MKKVFLIGIILVGLSAGGFFIWKNKNSAPQEEKTKKVVSSVKPEVNLLETGKRPFVTLIPREDGHEVSLNISDLKGGEKTVEYELEYQAGTLLQGAGGRIDFEEEKPPVAKKLLFGSCSKGKCKYDEDVHSGSLTLYFDNGEKYGLKTGFTLGTVEQEEGVFKTQDLKTSLEIKESSLSEDSFIVAMSTMGLPDEVKKEIVSGPVGFFASAEAKIEEALLTFSRVDSEADLKILRWDGEQWQEYETEKKEDSVIASVNSLGVFLLVEE